MKPMIYVIKFEENLDLGDIEFFIRVIKSPIRLEVGDKITLSFASFDGDLDKGYVDDMMEVLFKKSIKASKLDAYFEISDIIYNHEGCYYDVDTNFRGIITLKGK